MSWGPGLSAAKRLWRRVAPFLDRVELDQKKGDFLWFCVYLQREGLSPGRAWKAGLLDMRLPESERRLMVKQLKGRQKRRKLL